METWVLIMWLTTGNALIPGYESEESCQQAVEHLYSKEPWKSVREQTPALAFIDCIPGPARNTGG